MHHDLPPATKIDHGNRKLGRLQPLGLWGLQAMLAFLFAIAGTLKLSGNPEIVDNFDRIGAGPWLRNLTGVLEIAGAIGLLIPLLSGAAAVGLAMVTAGATATHLFILGDDPWLPVGYFVLSALVAWGRRAETKMLLDLVAKRRSRNESEHAFCG